MIRVVLSTSMRAQPPANVHQMVAQVSAEPIAIDLVEALDELATRTIVEWRVLGPRTIVHAGAVTSAVHAAGSVESVQRKTARAGVDTRVV
jgi:hypothetical protein